MPLSERGLHGMPHISMGLALATECLERGGVIIIRIALIELGGATLTVVPVRRILQVVQYREPDLNHPAHSLSGLSPMNCTIYILSLCI